MSDIDLDESRDLPLLFQLGDQSAYRHGFTFGNLFGENAINSRPAHGKPTWKSKTSLMVPFPFIFMHNLQRY